MRHSERLFQIVLTVGREGVVTGQRLAELVGVTRRTVYRDIRDLINAGVPIQGEAGVGYRLGCGYQIPPLMFTEEELQAMHLGASIIRSWADPGLAKSAEQALAKVDAVLPATMRPKLTYGAMIVPGGHLPTVIGENLSMLRGAISARRKVAFSYPRPFAERSQRAVRPLILAYWGGSWTLGGWCEIVSGFRTFRIDGIVSMEVTSDIFAEEDGKKVADYLAAAREHDAVLGSGVDALRANEKSWPTANFTSQ